VKPASVCAVGDIHGCSGALAELLPVIENRAESFVFLGDYIDRGPDAKGVIELLLAFRSRKPRTVFLMGNHERMLLDYLQGRDKTFFLNAGGVETLASYGLPPDANPEALRAQLPPEHLGFFSSLSMLWENDCCICVHAGLDPGEDISRQNAACCLWARDEFIRSRHDFGKTVVFGHTPFINPLMRREKTGIDTGAVYGGRLTALLLPQRDCISVPGQRCSYRPEFSGDKNGLFQRGTFDLGLSLRKFLRLFR
jgi:serine/threonine protein phosphatase 1